jgi:hypothetical protein
LLLIRLLIPFCDYAFFDYTIKKAIDRAWFAPLMASEVFDLPRASDGAGYDDHDNADYIVYGYDNGGRGNEAGCEARGHCQNFQFTKKVLEMQAEQGINFCYG